MPKCLKAAERREKKRIANMQLAWHAYQQQIAATQQQQNLYANRGMSSLNALALMGDPSAQNFAAGAWIRDTAPPTLYKRMADWLRKAVA